MCTKLAIEVQDEKLECMQLSGILFMFFSILKAVGTGDSPCSDIWPGYFAFSDPEALHLANFLLSTNEGRWKLFFTMHSYSQLWMAPYGYTTEPVVDYDKLVSFKFPSTD